MGIVIAYHVRERKLAHLCVFSKTTSLCTRLRGVTAVVCPHRTRHVPSAPTRICGGPFRPGRRRCALRPTRGLMEIRDRLSRSPRWSAPGLSVTGPAASPTLATRSTAVSRCARRPARMAWAAPFRSTPPRARAAIFSSCVLSRLAAPSGGATGAPPRSRAFPRRTALGATSIFAAGARPAPAAARGPAEVGNSNPGLWGWRRGPARSGPLVTAGRARARRRRRRARRGAREARPYPARGGAPAGLRMFSAGATAVFSRR